MEREDEEVNLNVQDLEELEHMFSKCMAKSNVSLEVIRVPMGEDHMPQP